MTFPRSLARLVRRADGVAHRLTGHAALADLEHVGRRSGIVRHTPLRAFRRGETVVVGLNFGRESDWVQNVVAAGRCTMHLGDEDLELGPPRLVPIAEVVAGMPVLFGLGLRYVVRTRECAEFPVLASSWSPG